MTPRNKRRLAGVQPDIFISNILQKKYKHKSNEGLVANYRVEASSTKREGGNLQCPKLTRTVFIETKFAI